MANEQSRAQGQRGTWDLFVLSCQAASATHGTGESNGHAMVMERKAGESEGFKWTTWRNFVMIIGFVRH